MSLSYAVYIRPLTPADCSSYRALRQEILRIGDGRFFSDSYTREAQLNETEWLKWCTETREHCILGTFAGTTLIGIMMITQQCPDGLSPVVEWEATWLAPSHRGKGIGKLAYEKALQWSRSQDYKYVVGFIRADNVVATTICGDMGFQYAYKIPGEVWADGSVADTNAHILPLQKSGAHEQQQQLALGHLEEVMFFLNQGLHAPVTKNEQPEIAIKRVRT